ncbi:ABC transporter permease [Arthrobacter castelli]|uniref:ABC transporter permease n=1 Tax=Arthrobacter castelli TaxID=271431 RepID=UPI0003F8B0B9|nr:ABC transporter permease [Arthrobacter castelli]
MSTTNTTTPQPQTTLGPGRRPGRRRPAPGVADAVLIGRSVRHSLRDVETMLMAVLLPVMLMLMFTYVFGGAISAGGTIAQDGGYVDYVVPGIILTCAGFGASSAAVDTATDMANGIIDRFRTMPMRSSAVLTGHTVASLARNLVATAVVILVALLVGFRPSAGPAQWLAAAGLVALYILAITTLFTAIGVVAGSPQAASGYGFVLLFLPYLSSAFVPVETMPGWLQPIAEYQPITAVNESLRALLMGTDPGWYGPAAVAWCIGIGAIGVIWGAAAFRRRAGRR